MAYRLIPQHTHRLIRMKGNQAKVYFSHFVLDLTEQGKIRVEGTNVLARAWSTCDINQANSLKAMLILVHGVEASILTAQMRKKPKWKMPPIPIAF